MASFLLLIVEPVGQRQARGPVAGEEVYARMLRYTEELQARGVLVASNSLGERSQRLQLRGGKRSLVDGPFAEAKEMVGGFFLVECRHRDEAVALAAECPAAEWATVEIRQVGPCFEDA